MTTIELARMSDEALVAESKRVAEVERRSMAELLTLLIEIERRGVHLALGHSSLFGYCTRALRLSEQAAYSRITAARAARRFPILLELLADGALTLSSLGLLAPHLTDENVDPLLDAARYKSTRDVERLIACLHPQPDIATSLRAAPVRPAAPIITPAESPLLDGAPQEPAVAVPVPSTASPTSGAIATDPRATCAATILLEAHHRSGDARQVGARPCVDATRRARWRHRHNPGPGAGRAPARDGTCEVRRSRASARAGLCSGRGSLRTGVTQASRLEPRWWPLRLCRSRRPLQ
jgi:hypothetical protein